MYNLLPYQAKQSPGILQLDFTLVTTASQPEEMEATIEEIFLQGGKCYLFLGVISHFCNPRGYRDVYKAKILKGTHPMFQSFRLSQSGP